MYSVKVYGAGSIGNHLTNAFRSKGFDVILTDISQEALDRAKNKIYPEDFKNMQQLLQLIEADYEISLMDLVKTVDEHPEIREIMMSGIATFSK